ncbi:FAD/NAD(P)-binding domain-containing protein [Decorospora gaudefroyi]|uniref:FAD/NAD(P)-binding domain-containing protein n=1 Tax=Decorospora gaudefroyi TaxID=184978 RepID=A0A6A5JXN7_9PLEO|nr:FAD/NAD(P)-binding domain-containing protein [Decorospora gaudefroyi]
MVEQKMQVVIVGGSLAGLIHAIVFKSLGHDVHVLEKSSTELLRSQAAGLSAGLDVQRFIKEYIRPEQAYAKIAGSMEMIDAQGVVINSIPSKDPYHVTTWSLLYNLFKSHFLADTDSKAKYETEKWVRGIKVDGEQLAITYSASGDEAQHETRADLVIAADGAYSTTRDAVVPGIRPQYAGFVTWRGAVPASAVSEASRKVLEGRILRLKTENGYTLSDHVPSESGSMDPEDSQFIWVWYDKMDETSQEFQDTFTDVSGKKHSTTIPRGKVNPEVWAKRQSSGATLSVPFAELIRKTTDPFVSAIRDSMTPKAVAHDGQLLIVGNAFSLFRPHTGSSTNQATRQALELADVFQDKMTLDEWQESSVAYERMTSLISKAFGEYCFTDKVPDILAAALKPEQKTE